VTSSVYILDTNSFRVFGNYYPEAFPSFWERIEGLAKDGRLVSCHEVAKELDVQNAAQHIDEWVRGHSELFAIPTADEMVLVAQILAIPHFQQLIGPQQRLRGLPVADPFLVARGMATGGCVITEESLKPNAARMPNVCEHFAVRYTNAQGFLGEVGWRF
jgi:hypothetical protein